MSDYEKVINDIATLPKGVGQSIANYARTLSGLNVNKIKELTTQWNKVADGCTAYCDQIDSAVKSLGERWQGDSFTAFQGYMGKYTETGRDMAASLKKCTKSLFWLTNDTGNDSSLARAQQTIIDACNYLLYTSGLDLSKQGSSDWESYFKEKSAPTVAKVSRVVDAVKGEITQALEEINAAYGQVSTGLTRLARGKFQQLPKVSNQTIFDPNYSAVQTHDTLQWLPIKEGNTPPSAQSPTLSTDSGSDTANDQPQGPALAATSMQSAGTTTPLSSVGLSTPVTHVPAPTHPVSTPVPVAAPVVPQPQQPLSKAQLEDTVNKAIQALSNAGKIDLTKVNLDPHKIATIIVLESSGRPSVVSADMPPRIGLMQMSNSDFQKYHLDGHNDITNPVDNTIAGIRRIIERGGTDSIQGLSPDSGRYFALFGPTGSDGKPVGPGVQFSPLHYQEAAQLA